MQKKKSISTSTPFSWQVHGVCSSATPPNDLIPIQEEISNLGWRYVRNRRPVKGKPKRPHYFGRPIETTLAVKFIRAGLTRLTNLLHSEKEENIKERNAFMEGALKLNYGITYDKAVILKILSQPNCEALRSYLCYRDDGTPHYSLVMIGVDKDGYDLNYYYTNGDDINDAQIETQSLVVEYGHPPDKITDISTDPKAFDDHYILLKYTGISNPF